MKKVVLSFFFVFFMFSAAAYAGQFYLYHHNKKVFYKNAKGITDTITGIPVCYLSPHKKVEWQPVQFYMYRLPFRLNDYIRTNVDKIDKCQAFLIKFPKLNQFWLLKGIFRATKAMHMEPAWFVIGNCKHTANKYIECKTTLARFAHAMYTRMLEDIVRARTARTLKGCRKGIIFLPVPNYTVFDFNAPFNQQKITQDRAIAAFVEYQRYWDKVHASIKNLSLAAQTDLIQVGWTGRKK